MAKYASLDILYEASELDAKHKRQILLTWNLLRFKVTYYYPELVDAEFKKPNTISDAQYDKYKAEYLDLCYTLDVDNMVVDGLSKHKDTIVRGMGMVEVDFKRPMVEATLDYIGIDGWKAEVATIIAEEKKSEPVKKKDMDKLEEMDEMMGWGGCC